MRAGWLWALVFVLLSNLGCAGEPDEGPLWADPGVVRLSPARARVVVEIHNRSGTVRPIGRFALGGDDWDTLRFVDDSLPRTIPGHDSVTVELALSPASFRSQPGVYRSGHASLSFSSDQFDYTLPIEFLGSDVDRSGIGAALLGALVLAGLALALAWAPLRAGPATRGPLQAPVGLRIAVAGAFAALLLVAATVPVGLGLCHGRLGALVGPRELEQCRAGLGGAELLALPGSPGSWWWLIALALATAAITAVRVGLAPARNAGHAEHAGHAGHAPAFALALAGLRLLGFALVLVALLCGLSPASADATDLVLAQTDTTTLVGLGLPRWLPRWGLIAQPLGFALGFALVVLAAPAPARSPTQAPLAQLERLELLVWAALLVTLFLGGPAIPGLSQRGVPLLAHGPQVILELSFFALEIAIVMILATRLRAQLSSDAGMALPSSRLLELLARGVIPLALLNLITVLIWLAI